MANDMRKSQHLLPNEVLDLTEEIALVTPTDTPLITMLYAMGNVTSASDITVSWREKELNSTRTTAQLEGAESPDAIKSTRRMISNICQILTRSTAVSGTLAALNPYGIGDEFAAEVQDRLIELKRDTEHFVINGTKQEENVSTPRQMNGLLNLINSNNVVTTNGELTPEHIETALEKMWNHGVSSNAIYAFVGAGVKKKINQFIKDDLFIKGTGTNTYGFQVDYITTDFGDCGIVLDRHMPADTIMILDMSVVELAYLRAPKYEPLAKTGDYQKGQVIAEPTVKLKNTYAGAKVVISG